MNCRLENAWKSFLNLYTVQCISRLRKFPRRSSTQLHVAQAQAAWAQKGQTLSEIVKICSPTYQNLNAPTISRDISYTSNIHPDEHNF